MENKYAKLSELSLEISNKDNKTILSDVYFTPPFKIMKPFYEKGLMRVLQMSASPGIMEGDCQKIDICVKDNSVCEIYSQSFEKIYKMEKGQAKRDINIRVGENCFFIYNPLPTIPYEKSAFLNKINVNLANSTSKFLFSDIVTSGRVLRGESFKYRYYNSFMTISEDKKLEYRDNTRFDTDKMNMSGIGIYEGFTHILSMVICNIDLEEDICHILKDYSNPWGITKNDKGYIILRALGKKAEELQNISDNIKKIVYNHY